MVKAPIRAFAYAGDGADLRMNILLYLPGLTVRMQKTPFLFSLLLAGFIFPLTVCAQHYIMKNGEAISRNFFHTLLAANNSEYVDVSYAYTGRMETDKFTITKYDSSLKEVYNRPFDGLTNKKYESSFFENGNLYILATDKEKNIYLYTWNDKSTSGQSSALLLSFTGNEYFISQGFSQDSSFCYIVCRNYDKKTDNEAFAGIIMDRSMKPVTKFSFTSEISARDKPEFQYALSGKGMFSILCASVRSEKRKAAATSYSITQINRDGNKTITQYDIPEDGITKNFVSYITGDTLHFFSLLSPSKKDGFTAVYTGSFDLLQSK